MYSRGFVLTLVLLSASSAMAQWPGLDEIFGMTGKVNADGVYKVVLPRTDVEVRMGGMRVPAGLGLASYAAFSGTPERAAVMGDTCMLAGEIDRVIDALRAGGIEVVALHNHMVAESPSLYFLHFQGVGRAEELAKTVKAAFDVLGFPQYVNRQYLTGPEIDWDEVSKILGRPLSGPSEDGVYKATLPRPETETSLDGVKFGTSAGFTCWAAFVPTNSGRAMVMGDTVTTREDLQGAIDALRAGGLSIVAIHNHVVGAGREVLFMHIMGEGPALYLARTVRAAWDALKRK